MDARDDGRVEGIVWLEKGDEVAFEPAGPRRPWLEESSGWSEGPHPEEPQGTSRKEPPKLVWL